MSADIFLAYSRSNETEAKALKHALKELGLFNLVRRRYPARRRLEE